jgi:thiamine kinase-like enzyme
VPAKFQRWNDIQITAAGVLLRSLHDATRDSGLIGEHSVVCHHDPGPNNTVFQAGLPVAFIDFDTAAAGEPLEDLGYMAWTWCISSKADAPPAAAQAAQVRILADAYGLTAARRADVLDAILDRQSRNARWWTERLSDPGLSAVGPEQINSSIEWSKREHTYTSTNCRVFAAALR